MSYEKENMDAKLYWEIKNKQKQPYRNSFLWVYRFQTRQRIQNRNAILCNLYATTGGTNEKEVPQI